VRCAKPTCGKAMGEDEKFGYDMRLLGLPQRRYYCSDGHSVTTGIPALADLEPKIVPGQYADLEGARQQRVRVEVKKGECTNCARAQEQYAVNCKLHGGPGYAVLHQGERCRNGHERTMENTFVGNDGHRRCRECQRDFAAIREAARRSGPDVPHCRRGHPYTPENVRIRKDGSRRCLMCLTASDVGRWGRMTAEERAKRLAREQVSRRERRARACRRGHAYNESNPYQQGKWCVVCKNEQQVQRLERMSVGLVAAH
jgi:hypothetical protein